MKKYREALAVGMIICLGAVKALYPGHSEQLRRTVGEFMWCRVDYGQVISVMGRRFCEGGAGEELVSALRAELKQDKIPAAGFFTQVELFKENSRL